MKRFWLVFTALLLVIGSAAAERKSPVLAETDGTISAEIRVLGDFIIHDSIIAAAQDEARRNGSPYDCDFSAMLAPVKELIGDADFTVANVDGVFYGSEKRSYSGYPAFNTPPALIYALKDVGVDALTMANNHGLDFWYDGLKVSVTRVDEAGMMHLGAARSQEEHDIVHVVTVKGISIGLLNYTSSLNSMERQKGLDPDALAFGINFTKYADYKKDVRALREAGAEIVVCFMHWGTEYQMTKPTAEQVSIAKELVEAGVDVIVGGHPHVPEQADWLTGVNQFGEKQTTLCVYSLGNFLSGQRISGRDGGVIFRFVVEKDAEGRVSVADASYISTWVWKKGNTFRILPALGERPDGLSGGDWRDMQACVRIQETAMQNGSLKLRAGL